MKYNFISVSETGLKRACNEDSIGIYNTPEGLLIIVCDGLGGNNAGEIASQMSVEAIYKNFISLPKGDYLKIIKDSITKANQLIKEKSKNDIKLWGMATTAEVLLLVRDTAYWGHVGDSRIYFWKNGKLKQVTKDHSLVQDLIDQGKLTMKEAENHPNKNIILRAVGDKKDVDVDLSKQRLNRRDDLKFFICTDGVSGVISDDELEILLKQKRLNKTGETIKHIIDERGAPDNYSFVIIENNPAESKY